MELHLQPLAATCFVSGRPFAEGDRVVSALVRTTLLEIVRYDLLAEEEGKFSPEGFVACRWTHLYKPRSKTDNPERALKLGAENLFLALSDPSTEPTPENNRLIQFLALMLERKKVLRARGRSSDGERIIYEHGRLKQRFELPAGELTPEFFVAVQEQLTVLVGEPKPKGEAAPAPQPGPTA